MNKAIIITGASAGIGAETAVQLGGFKLALVLNARRADALEAVAEKARKAGGEVVCVVGDVCERETREKIIKAALELGGIGGLVNNAGVSLCCPGEFVDQAHLERQMSCKSRDLICQIQ